MKEEKKILKNSLKKLVNRFGREDFVSALIQNPEKGQLNEIALSNIKDNHYLKKAKIDEVKITSCQKTIKEGKTLEPVIIRKYEKGYEVVVGRVRYQAALKEKLEKIPVIEVQLDDEESLLFMFTEISDRKTLNIYELALICDALKKEFNYKNKELAEYLDQSPSQISNLLKILDLPEEILVDISTNRLSYGHAKTISRLGKEEALKAVATIHEKNLSVRDTELLIKGETREEKVAPKVEETSSSEVKEDSLKVDGLKVTLTFKDEKALAEGIKRLNKYIKRKKIVLK